MKWWTVFTLILLLCIVSCARDDDSQQSTKPEPSSQSPSERPEQAKQTKQADQSEQPGKPSPAMPKQPAARDEGGIVSKREITLTQAAPEQPDQTPASQTEQQQLLTLESAAVLPEDFKIGPLADLVGVDRNTREMVSTATRLLNALGKGNVAAESLEKNVREELTNSINYYLQQELIPLTYRIGAVSMETGEQHSAWMNIRLFGSPGVTEGELYLEKTGGRWYVSDLQINFEMMKEEYTPEQEKYFPANYGWGIQ